MSRGVCGISCEGSNVDVNSPCPLRPRKVSAALPYEGADITMITLYVGKPETMPQTEPLDAAVLGMSQVLETLNSFSLFGDKPVYRITGIDSSEALRDEFLKLVPEIAKASSDAVVVLEKLLAADRKKVGDYATIIESKPKPQGGKSEPVNPFSLANAFATGDKKKAWIMFHEVTSADDEMEKTHGMIWWKLKDMVQKKGPFSSEQLKSMARSLVSVYHESRIGGLSMKERLEEFFLTLPEVKK